MLVSPRKQRPQSVWGRCCYALWALPAVPDLHDKTRRKPLLLGCMAAYTEPTPACRALQDTLVTNISSAAPGCNLPAEPSQCKWPCTMDLSFPVCLRRLFRLLYFLGQAPLLDTTTPKHHWLPRPPPLVGPMFPVHLVSIETLVCWPEIA